MKTKYSSYCFNADSIPVVSAHYVVKQHKLDVVILANLFCTQLKQKTAGIICL